MITVAERITVAFAGGGGGVEELSWGQRDIWLVMVRQKFWLPIGGWKRLPEGTTVQDVAEELRYLMSRYQSMRTRLRFDDDGRPSQVVFSAGEIGLDVIDIGDEDDPDVFAGSRTGTRTLTTTSSASGRCGWRCYAATAYPVTWSSSCATWSATGTAGW